MLELVHELRSGQGSRAGDRQALRSTSAGCSHGTAASQHGGTGLSRLGALRSARSASVRTSEAASRLARSALRFLRRDLVERLLRVGAHGLADARAELLHP